MEVAAAASTQVKKRIIAGAVAFLLLATVVLAVLGGVLAARVQAAEQADRRRQAILHAARQEAVYLVSLDYKTTKADLQRILSGATGEVEKTFAENSDVMQQTLKQNKAVSQGEALDAGIISADKDSAEVMVVANSTVKNKKVTDGKIVRYRMWMGLVRKDGRWLVSTLGFNKRGFQASKRGTG